MTLKGLCKLPDWRDWYGKNWVLLWWAGPCSVNFNSLSAYGWGGTPSLSVVWPADGSKPTKEDRATEKWGQSPDAPCLEPPPHIDGLHCEIINLLKFKLTRYRFSANVTRRINQHMLCLLLGGASFAWRSFFPCLHGQVPSPTSQGA